MIWGEWRQFYKKTIFIKELKWASDVGDVANVLCSPCTYLCSCKILAMKGEDGGRREGKEIGHK